MTPAEAHITVNHLTMAYGSFVIQRDLSFTVQRGDIFIIMGGSGCGKSTLLRHLIGLRAPAQGEVLIDGESFWAASPEAQDRVKRRFGVLFQSGALWSSMTLAENVALPLEQYTALSPARIRKLVALKLALVGLAGFEDYYPSQISGGMQKRAGLARAMALDPDILFFDEPSAGLDPISSRLLDELILELRDSLGATVVVVTHELASIFAIGNNSVFLDADTKTMIASGDPEAVARCLPRSEGPDVSHPRGRERPDGLMDRSRPRSINERSSAVNRANPKLIGAFVVGAVALVVVGVLLLGGAKFLTEKRTFVAYFEGSVKGLNVGAPVEFQGVQVGSVTDIQLQFLTAENEFRIPVFIQIEPGRMTQVGRQIDAQGQLLKPLIERGLRAQLEMQSLVTGQLIVQLGFYPDTPIRLVGDGKVPEIPTVPTTMQEVAQNVTQALTEFRQLPIPQLIGQLVEAAQGLNTLIHSPEVKNLIRSVSATAQVAERSLQRVDDADRTEVARPLKTRPRSRDRPLARQPATRPPGRCPGAAPLQRPPEDARSFADHDEGQPAAHPPCGYAGDADGG